MEPIPAHGAAAGEAHVAAVQHKLSQFTNLLPGIEEWHPMSAEMAEVLLVMLGLGLGAPYSLNPNPTL